MNVYYLREAGDRRWGARRDAVVEPPPRKSLRASQVIGWICLGIIGVFVCWMVGYAARLIGIAARVA